ncbi:MAG: threonine ammonia-lyase [Nevskiaceae bacterium]
MTAPTLQDIRAAADTLRGKVVHTPSAHSQVLSKLTGAEVWLKFENLQFTASFKDRGACNKLLSLTAAERQAGVCTMSAGNHAQAVAYRATQLGIKSTIVMPKTTPFSKVRSTRELGAEVILQGSNLAESQDWLEANLKHRGMTLVHPYDDPVIMAGAGTCGLEFVEAVPELDTLVIPIGGGGLFAGCAIAAHALNPKLRLIGVETTGYCSAYAAITGDPSLVKGGSTIAEGIAVKYIGKQTLPVIREHATELVRVEDAQLERAIGLLVNIEKVVVEGAGAAALAALLADPAKYAGRKVGLVVTGGNIDPRMLSSVLMRQLVHEQRLIGLSVDIEDTPGVLAKVAGRVGESGGNILQVHHERLSSGLAKGATLEMLVEAQDEAHANQIVADLRAAGWTVRRVHSGFGELE